MQKGRIINLNGGIYKVLLEDNSTIFIKARGKLRCEKRYIVNEKSYSKKAVLTNVKNSPKVGDIVYIENDMIDKIEPRKNELIRPDIANVDQILLVFAAAEPEFSFYLLDLFLVNILKQNITPIIVISKIDKLQDAKLYELKNMLSYYTQMGYKVIYVNSLSKEGIDEVSLALEEKITVLSGQTGAGKSTLINALIPDFNLQTQEISSALGRGKHTTRETNLYEYKKGFIGDTPGFSKLDVLGVDRKDLPNLFIEFKNYHCRFKDCNHTKDILGCGVHEACDKGLILKSRYDSYLKMVNLIIDKEKRK